MIVVVWRGYGWLVPVLGIVGLSASQLVLDPTSDVSAIIAIGLPPALVFWLTLVLELRLGRRTPPSPSLRPDKLIEHWWNHSPDWFMLIPVRFWSPIMLVGEIVAVVILMLLEHLSIL